MVVAIVVVTASVVAPAAAVLAKKVSADDPPPPGVSAGVSSLVRLPPVAALPKPVARFVEFSSRARATNPEEAKARVRKLRSDLGAAHADLYAFTNAAGAPCFILVGNESRGLPEEYEAACDLRVTLPMKGRADSLNAAMAGAVLAYEVLARLGG